MTFYVKYVENQAVPIDTHYNNMGEQERRRPLSTVAHLIAAYKTAVVPILGLDFPHSCSLGHDYLSHRISIQVYPAGESFDNQLLCDV